MTSRNHYVILGVQPAETAQGIRAAFRDLARRYHPDHAGPSGAATFHQIVEAYGVLSDAGRRRRYDAALEEAERRELLPREVSLRRDVTELRPSEDALVARFARNFTKRGSPKAEGVAELLVDVAISEEEAGRGTRVQLGVPVFTRCGVCLGGGCVACGAQGVLERERVMAFDIPPMTGSGVTLLVPLQGLGIHNFYLRVRVRVDPQLEPGIGKKPAS
jgi:DnaJ-class molecular chaperone